MLTRYTASNPDSEDTVSDVQTKPKLSTEDKRRVAEIRKEISDLRKELSQVLRMATK